jgi:hypothetical protein
MTAGAGAALSHVLFRARLEAIFFIAAKFLASADRADAWQESPAAIRSAGECMAA